MYKLITGISIFFTAVVASPLNSSAQSIMATIGDFSFNNEGYSVSYTLGECFIQQPLHYNDGFICEGFQQGVWDTLMEPPVDDVKVFPNPIKENPVLYVALPEKGPINSYIITVISMTGQILDIHPSGIFEISTTVEIPFHKYGKGLYLIKIVSVNGGYDRTFKVEKLN